MERHVVLAEVTELLATYCHHIDDGEFEAWSRLFLPDGVFRGPGRPPVQGRANLQRFAATRHLEWPVRHITYNTALKITSPRGTSIEARSDFHVLSLDPAGPRVSAVGIYYDTLFRTSDGLRFAERVAARVY